MDPSQIPIEILNGPAGAPPPGVTPNFIDPPSSGPVLTALPAVLVAIMWILVVVRFITKTRITKKITLDDYTCVIAAVFTTMYFGVTTAAVEHLKIGTHIWNVRLGDYLGTGSVKIELLSSVLAPPTLLFIKVTFFIMFLHIFKPVVLLRVLCWLGIIVTVLGYTGFFVALMVLSIPRWGETWQSHFVGPLQIQSAYLSIPLPAFGLGLDIYILILPIYGVWNLQLTTKRKLGVAAIFLTAIVAIVCSILAIVFRLDLQGKGEEDLTYKLMPAYLTSDLEMTLGVIVSCMSTFSGAITRTLPFYNSLKSFFTSRFSQQRRHSDDSNQVHLDNLNAPQVRQGAKPKQQGVKTSDTFGLNHGYSSQITAGKPWNRSEDGIVLTTEVHQTSSPV